MTTASGFFDGPRPRRFAHRGGSGQWPENTLEAFEGALTAGCECVETDLHSTRDGVLVLHHDERVDRTTDGVGLVRNYSFDVLRRLDAGFRFTPDGKSFPYRGRGLRIPTLDEALSMSKSARFNIEIKQPEPSIVAPFWDTIRRHAAYDRVLAAAARDRLVREFRKVSAGRVATSAGTTEVVLFWLAARTGLTGLMPVAYDALQVPVSERGLTIVDHRFVEAAHARGVEVHVWTIDDPSEMARLLELGVDGLMSDYPERLVAATPR